MLESHDVNFNQKILKGAITSNVKVPKPPQGKILFKGKHFWPVHSISLCSYFHASISSSTDFNISSRHRKFRMYFIVVHTSQFEIVLLSTYLFHVFFVSLRDTIFRLF